MTAREAAAKAARIAAKSVAGLRAWASGLPARMSGVTAARAARVATRVLTGPPLAGAIYLTALALWAARTPPEDPQQLGAEAHRIEAIVEGRFGAEITRLVVAIVAAAIVQGLVLGIVADALVTLRERLQREPRLPSFDEEGLDDPPPSAAQQVRRWLTVLGVVACLQALLEFRAMAAYPQLYAAAWYAQGTWRRTVQVLASDDLHPGGVALLAALACAAFLAGPRSAWPGWTGRLRRAAEVLRARGRRVAAIGASAMALVLLAFLVGHLPSAHARAATDATRPNVLILAADSLRADRLVPRTAPRLSALADKATRFDRAYVSLPRTFPSWVTWLTGRHPHHHGIRSMFPRWEERARDFDALPARLARAGWSTGVVSDYAGDIFSRIDLGFGTVDVPEFDFRELVRQRVLERETPLLPLLHSRVGRAAFPVLREMNDAADPQMLARDAVHTMRQLEAGGPFFLVVFFSTAHFPYAAPDPYYARFADPKYRGRFKYDKPVGLGREAPADARDQQQVQALYDGAVSAIDDAAASVLDALEDDGVARNTIVVVTGDHGETLYDHGHGQGHGDHLFGDEGTHVPLVVFDPRSATPPRRVESIVRDVDLAPTIYALTHVLPPQDLDGRSLAPALAGQSLPPALAYAETGLWFTEDIPGLASDLRLPYPGIERLTEVDTQHGDELVLDRAMKPTTLVAKHRMVRDERYKLVYVPARTGVRWLLFDTQADPGEERDVAGDHPDVVARLQRELWSWMRRDPDMVERGGYLVPRGAAAPSPIDVGVLRLGDEASPPAAGSP